MAVKIIFPWLLILFSSFYSLKALNNDLGNFQQYVSHRRWSRELLQATDDPCLVNYNCGHYGICTSVDSKTTNCGCIPGYIPVDPNDPSKGRHPEIAANYCPHASTKDFIVKVIDDAELPQDGFVDLARVEEVNFEGCEKALMDDCYTLAASLVNSTCHKKRTPLYAIKSASTTGKKALIKVQIKRSSPVIPKKKNFDVWRFLKILRIINSTLAFLFGATALYYHPATQRLLKRNHSSNANAIGVGFREFTLQELHEATNGFSKMLGRGSSGKVYAGLLNLKDEQIEIAVKKLEKEIEKSDKEFMTELKIIGRTYHKNLVRLLGFCIENDQRLLVYEFMTNGALSGLLFGEGEKPSWFLRAEIAVGIARGLLYLHEECENQIIHCDIKPQNVLLDTNYTAKIADFGLSKLLNRDQTRTDTDVRGTMGYLAPEWLRRAAVTTKVDVFSFGMMLLEIICGRRQIELSRVEEESEDDDLILSNWVLKSILSGKLEMVVGHDPEVLSDFKRFERMAMVGLWCIHPDPVLRPSMKRVTQMLEGTSEVGVPPLLNDQIY